MRLRAIINCAAAALAALVFANAAYAADNYTGKDASAATKTFCAKDAAGVLSTCNVIKKADGATSINPATEEKQDALQTSMDALNAKIVAPSAGTFTTTVTRPADTTPYGVNDAWADSTSAPTSGGFTFANACRASGGTSMLTTLTIVSSNDPSTLLQGEIFIFNAAGTAVNDNALFALSDSDALKLVGRVPFVLESSQNTGGTNSFANLTNLGLSYTCVGTANLRFLIKVKNAYTPASGESLQISGVKVDLN